MKHLSKHHHFFSFSGDNKPALAIKSGDAVEIETMDCFSNQITRPGDTIESIDWDLVNPATGPIWVEGAKPGDVLKVTIESICVGKQGVMATGEGLGVFGDHLTGMSTRLIPIEGDYARFDEDVTVPLNKMIGVIGVAPEGEPVNCGTPGAHGGNMDTKLISEGSSVYLPVFKEGALFGTGDVHAAMGDGEVCVTGVEITSRLTLKFEVVRGLCLRSPLVENGGTISTIASEPNLEEAARRAALDMEALVLDNATIERDKLAMLFSAVGDLQVSQVVDPLRTARFTVPLAYLAKYGFELERIRT